MIKIKAEQKYITLLLYVILITILAGIYIFLCKIHGKNFQIENCIFIAIFILVIIFNLINSSEYVSEIRISHSHIEIIYKKGLIESKREIIFKNDIVSFESIATINKNIISRRNEIKSNTLIKINLTDKKCIKFLVDSTNRLYGCPYQFILDLIKFSREIPNFKYEILGNYYFAKKDIENYIQYGRGLNTKEQLLYAYNSQPPYVIFFFIFFIASMLIIIGVLIYSSIQFS